MKTLIIIPNEEEYNLPVYTESFDDSLQHASRYKEYAIANQISYSDNLETVFGWGKNFSLHGFLSIILDQERVVCFCPDYLSENQYKWLKKNYNIFRKGQLINIPFSAVHFSMDSEEYFENKLEEPEYNPLKQFYKEIKKRYKGELKNESTRTYSK